MSMQFDDSLVWAFKPRKLAASGYQSFAFSSSSCASDESERINHNNKRSIPDEPATAAASKRPRTICPANYRLTLEDYIEAFKQYYEETNIGSSSSTSTSNTLQEKPETCDFTHRCSCSCDFLSFKTLMICLSSGHLHECTESACNMKVSSVEGKVCELTGTVYSRALCGDATGGGIYTTDDDWRFGSADVDIDEGGGGGEVDYAGTEFFDEQLSTSEYREAFPLAGETVTKGMCSQKTQRIIDKLLASMKKEDREEAIAIVPVKKEEEEEEAVAIAAVSLSLSLPPLLLISPPEPVKEDPLAAVVVAVAEAKETKKKKKPPQPQQTKAQRKTRGLTIRSTCEYDAMAMNTIQCIFKPNLQGLPPPPNLKRRKIKQEKGGEEEGELHQITGFAPTRKQMEYMSRWCVDVWQRIVNTELFKTKSSSYLFDYHVLVVVGLMITGFVVRQDPPKQDVCLVPVYNVAAELLHARTKIIEFNPRKWKSGTITRCESLFRELVRQMKF